jgi:hypothetical protein
VCNADNTPLYTFGDSTAGDGQVRVCRDWNSLREYAAKNSACYVDTIKEVNLIEHFGNCEERKGDGLVLQDEEK